MRIDTQVKRVVIYRNGALVTRHALATGDVEVWPLPLTYNAESLRVRVSSGRVSDVRELCRLEHEGEYCSKDALKESLERQQVEIKQKIEAAEAKKAFYSSFFEDLPDAELGGKRPNAVDLAKSHAVCFERLDELDAEELALEEQLQNCAQKLEALEEGPVAHAYRGLSLHIEAPSPVELEIEYFVEAARFVPCYALSLEGDLVRLKMQAQIAQATGEDWRGAQLSVSTRSLDFATVVPELQSWRIGVAQPAPKPAYRPLPSDFEQLFPEIEKDEPAEFSGTPRRNLMAARNGDRMLQVEAMAGVGAAPMAMSMPMPMPMAMAMPRTEPRLKKMARSARGAARSCECEEMCVAESCVEDSCDEISAPSPKKSQRAPHHAWLRLKGFDEPGRGTLVQVNPEEHLASLLDHREVDDVEAIRAAVASLKEAQRRLESLTKPAGTTVPCGGFAIYSADGPRDCPADGAWHHVDLFEESCVGTFHDRAVPKVANDFYRYCEISLPGRPLPKGPMSITIDGAFVATSTLEQKGVGGKYAQNLGLDSAVRVVERTSRVQQQDRGLLSAQTEIDTTVTLRVRSGRREAVPTQIFERIPVGNEEGLEITLLSSSVPVAQKDRGPYGDFVAGAMRFDVTLPPGEVVTIEFSYRMKFPAKNEVVGGNRRD